MRNEERVISALRRISTDNHRCFGCGHENNCSIHGCAIIREGVELIQSLQAALTESEQARAELGQRLGLALSKLQDVEQAAESLSRRLGAASAVLETAAQNE